MIVLHTHRYHPPKFHPNLKHHDGDLIFFPFRVCYCLLLACLLLLLLLLLLNLVGPPQTLKRVIKPRLVPPAVSLTLPLPLTLTPPPFTPGWTPP